jgi:threonylcarbamoyladenosine tRNA methylthiotransferase MtaB
MKSVAYSTIGCKLNQFETEQIRETLEARGHASAARGAAADVYIINTCTVTHKSDYRSRQAVRRAIKANPHALIVVTGCYAQRSPEEIAEIPGVDVILGNAGKIHIADFVDGQKQSDPLIEVTEPEAQSDLSEGRELRHFGSYTRAFVKIQDGCDYACSYCAVPSARGRSRSKSPGAVRREIELLTGEGYKEVVLTGVHLGQYGKDLEPKTDLAHLLRDVAGAAGLKRLRLSSVEPNDLTDELIDLIADSAMKICPHVHVPLQSGDDGILEVMGRHYTRGFYADLVVKIAERIPDCGIGLDVMVGFPGEDDRAFQNSYDLIDSLPITYLHCFSFSRRPGTKACDMGGLVQPEEKKRRSSALRELGRRKNHDFRRSLIGKHLEVLILAKCQHGRLTGLSANYVRCAVSGAAGPNDLIPVRVLAAMGNAVLTSPAYE